MAKTVKCPKCKKDNDKSVAVLIPHGSVNKYYCPECAEEHNKVEQCSVCGESSNTTYNVQGTVMCNKCYKVHKKSKTETKKCVNCGNYRAKASSKAFSDGWYCASCTPARQKESELHVSINEFLKLQQGEHYNPPLLNKQIKSFREEQNMTLSGIYKTLRYIVEIKEKSLAREGVGLVPYYYNEARNFYKHRRDITVNALATPREQWIVEQVVYTIREEHKPRLKRPMLNMEDIEID